MSRSGSVGSRRDQDRINVYRAVGLDMILYGFLHFAEEILAFGRDIIAKLA